MNTVDGAGTNRLDGPPAALPRFETGLAVAELDLHGGALFWEEVKGFTAGPAAAPLVDRVLKARPLPRVWLFLDEPEQTATRAAAALAAARELGRRRYTALVIDADDHRPDLTRWAGRHEREGWIDLVRYGASLAAGSVPVPFEEEPAARLLGVGSFCPAEATREEIAWLCARLSSQADFLLIAAPLGPDGEAWLPAAQLRLLCWDRTGRSEAATAALAAGAAAAGAALGGLVTFGAPGLELLPPPPTPAAGQAAGAAAAEGAGGEDGEARSLPPVPAAAAAVAGAAGAADAAGSPAATGPTVARGGDEARRRSSSPLPRRLAVVLSGLVVIVGAALAWQLFQPRPKPDLSQLAPPSAAPDISRPVAPPPGGEAGSAADVGPATAVTAGMGALDSAGSGPARADTAAPPPAGTAGAPDGGTAAAPSGDTAAAAAVDAIGSAGAGAPPARPAAPAAPPAEAALDLAPFRLPVGQDGWALHVYSLPDSAQAEREIRRLRELGLTAGWRAVELPGRGRWYRISLGSFPDRAAAARALPALLRRLDADWGQPVSY